MFAVCRINQRLSLNLSVKGSLIGLLCVDASFLASVLFRATFERMGPANIQLNKKKEAGMKKETQ